MAEERPRRRSRRVGTPGIVAAVALVAIAGAWLVTTFGGGVAGAYEGAMNRMFAPSDEELRTATSEYFEALSYEGSDGDEYKSQIEPTVFTDTFYSSDTDTGERGGIGYGGDEVQSMAEGLNDFEGDAREEVELREFEVENKNRDEAMVRVEYEERFYEDGDLGYFAVGRQTMELAQREDEWRVARVTKVRNLEVNEPE